MRSASRSVALRHLVLRIPRSGEHRDECSESDKICSFSPTVVFRMFLKSNRQLMQAMSHPEGSMHSTPDRRRSICAKIPEVPQGVEPLQGSDRPRLKLRRTENIREVRTSTLPVCLSRCEHHRWFSVHKPSSALNFLHHGFFDGANSTVKLEVCECFPSGIPWVW